MTIATISALPALARLTSSAASVVERQDRQGRAVLLCTYRRTALADIPGLAELVGAHVPLVRVKTGSSIYHYREGALTVRSTAKLRHHVVVAVTL